MAEQDATNTMQALSFGFISDNMKEGYSINIETDRPDHILVSATKGEVHEAVEYWRTNYPENYPNYSKQSEHHEV